MMENKKEILVLNGSACAHSSNERLIERFKDASDVEFKVTVWPDLKLLPHFDPEVSVVISSVRGFIHEMAPAGVAAG
jgi:hypothetical protein